MCDHARVMQKMLSCYIMQIYVYRICRIFDGITTHANASRSQHRKDTFLEDHSPLQRFILTGLAVCAGLESLGVFHHSHNAFAGMVFGAIVRDHVLLRHSVSRHQLCPLDIYVASLSASVLRSMMKYD